MHELKFNNHIKTLHTKNNLPVIIMVSETLLVSEWLWMLSHDFVIVEHPVAF